MGYKNFNEPMPLYSFLKFKYMGLKFNDNSLTVHKKKIYLEKFIYMCFIFQDLMWCKLL